MQLDISREGGLVTIKGDRRSMQLLGETIARLVNQPYYPYRKTEREIPIQTLTGKVLTLKLEIPEDAMPQLFEQQCPGQGTL